MDLTALKIIKCPSIIPNPMMKCKGNQKD